MADDAGQRFDCFSVADAVVQEQDDARFAFRRRGGILLQPCGAEMPRRIPRGGVPVKIAVSRFFDGGPQLRAHLRPAGEAVDLSVVSRQNFSDLPFASVDVGKQRAGAAVDLPVAMGLAVDADGMPFGGGAPEDVFSSRDLPADDKKSRRHPFLLQGVEHGGGGRIGRPVIECQIHCFTDGLRLRACRGDGQKECRREQAEDRRRGRSLHILQCVSKDGIPFRAHGLNIFLQSCFKIFDKRAGKC